MLMLMIGPLQRTSQVPAKFSSLRLTVEICGGSGVLSKAMADAGLIVCTPIDLSASKHYDLRDLKLVN